MVPVSSFEMDGGSLPVVPQVSGARGHGGGGGYGLLEEVGRFRKEK